MERLLLEVADRHTRELQEMGLEARVELARRYQVQTTDTSPKVYFRLTDNWLELTVRFVAREHGVRDLKDAMSRDLLKGLEEAGVEVASATFQIVGRPQVRVELESARPPDEARPAHRAPAPAPPRG